MKLRLVAIGLLIAIFFPAAKTMYAASTPLPPSVPVCSMAPAKSVCEDWVNLAKILGDTFLNIEIALMPQYEGLNARILKAETYQTIGVRLWQHEAELFSSRLPQSWWDKAKVTEIQQAPGGEKLELYSWDQDSFCSGPPGSAAESSDAVEEAMQYLHMLLGEKTDWADAAQSTESNSSLLWIFVGVLVFGIGLVVLKSRTG